MTLYKMTDNNETTQKCNVCNVNVLKKNYTRHLKSKKHQDNLEQQGGVEESKNGSTEPNTEPVKDTDTYCNVCDKQYANVKSLKKHFKSKLHKFNLKKQSKVDMTDVVEDILSNVNKTVDEKQQNEPVITVVWEPDNTCSYDCSRMRKSREKQSGKPTVPKPRRNWISINGKIETKDERSKRLAKERQMRYREKKRLEKQQK